MTTTQQLFQEVRTQFSPILETRHFEKDKLLHEENKICYNIFLVESGALRSFYHADGRDVTAHFALEYGIVGAADSIIRGTSSRYNIETLEVSKVHVLDYTEMEAFLDERPQLERLARKFSQLLYIDLVERLEGMTFLSAKERYDHLIARYPTITQRVNLRHIASYMGITQETLSRVRGKR